MGFTKLHRTSSEGMCFLNAKRGQRCMNGWNKNTVILLPLCLRFPLPFLIQVMSAQMATDFYDISYDICKYRSLAG